MKGIKGKKNPNMARKGKENPFWGKSHSEKTKKKMSEAHKGKKRPPFTREHRRKLSEVRKGIKLSEETKNKLRQINLGKHYSETTRRKKSEAQKGEKGSNWQGGISFIIYPQDWTDDLKESIRKRDNYTCQECGIHKDEINYKLHIHHIDYDKYNLNPINLISLCRNCHMKTNYNREKWLIYFKKL